MEFSNLRLLLLSVTLTIFSVTKYPFDDKRKLANNRQDCLTSYSID